MLQKFVLMKQVYKIVYKIGKSRVQKIGLTSDHFPGRRVLSFQNLLGKYELSIQVKIKLDFRNCFSRAKM